MKIIMVIMLGLVGTSYAGDCIPYYQGCGMASREEVKEHWEDKERDDSRKAQQELSNDVDEMNSRLERRERDERIDRLMNQIPSRSKKIWE